MPPKVEFLFDFGSPNAFLCHRVIPSIEGRTGIRFEYVPVLLGGIFKATGNESPATQFRSVRNKPEYQRLEIERFIRRHRIKGFGYSPYFPVNTLMMMRGAIAARALGTFERYVETMFHNMWVDHKKLDEPAIFAQVLIDAGFDPGELGKAIADPGVKAQLFENTDRAVERGAFGSPTFFVNEEMWFGKEHLSDVEEEIYKHMNRDQTSTDVACRQDVRQFPETALDSQGFELHRVQCGVDPKDWKPMTGVGAA